MALPGSSNTTVNDLVLEVADALQQRTDVSDIAPHYIKRATQEITESYTFEELRRTGPLVSLTALQPNYPVSFFLNTGDDYTSLEVLSLYVDYPTNSVKFDLNYKTPKALDSMTSPTTRGVPAYWTRFGTQISVGPVPQLPYSMQAKYQIKHPFPDDETGLKGATLYIPSSWEEIVALSAAMRISFIKGWSDRRNEIHGMLYGDPEFQMSEGKRGRPGLIAARVLQVERDQRFNSRSLGIVVGRYGAR